jgi:endonuclease YncB( thermonuclease family)
MTSTVHFPHPRGWRLPRLSTVRLVVLIALVVAIFIKEGLGLDIPSVSSQFFTPGGGQFTLCGRWNQVQCVVDGDTIHYAGLKIRLEDIDAPETYQHKCDSELVLGKRATNRLLELINAGPFELVNRGGRDEDRFGRKLRTIERNGRSLGDMLVTEGLARRWDSARRSWCG